MTTKNAIHPKPSSRTYATVDISTAADGVSDSVNLSGLTLSAIQMSTAWTGSNIGFKASVDGSTNFYDVYNSLGNHLTYPTSANRVVAIDPMALAGLERIQLVSKTTAGVAVAQAAAREIRLGLSEFVNAN
jgi:hypothetical protein